MRHHSWFDVLSLKRVDRHLAMPPESGGQFEMVECVDRAEVNAVRVDCSIPTYTTLGDHRSEERRTKTKGIRDAVQKSRVGKRRWRTMGPPTVSAEGPAVSFRITRTGPPTVANYRVGVPASRIRTDHHKPNTALHPTRAGGVS